MIPYYSQSGITLYQGDCLPIIHTLADAGTQVDLVLADLPYGTTQSAWDTVIPLGPLWAAYTRLLKPNGVVVLTGAEPFTSVLITSNLAWFRYRWVWDKRSPVDHLNAKKRPLQQHEDVCVFSPATLGNFAYNPRMTTGERHPRGAGERHGKGGYGAHSGGDAKHWSTEHYPTTILSIPRLLGTQHPNEKPVALMSYLILTYSKVGDLVLDNTMGSGTTMEAAKATGRRGIGIELVQEYAALVPDRLQQEVLLTEAS